MNEKELLQAIGALMDEKLEPIKADISEMKEDILTLKSDMSALKNDVSTLKSDVEILKENTEISREGINTLLEWADKAQTQVRIPLLPIAE